MVKSNQLELVLVPSSGIGHLQSAVVLAKRIIEHDPRISILVLILHLSLDSSMVNDFVDFHTRHNRLTFMHLPPLVDPTATPTFFHSISLHVPLVKQTVRKRIIQQAGSGSTRRRLGGFIVDMFCPAMMDVAADFNVPSYVYFTSGANFLNLWLHLQSLVDENGIDVDVITELSDDPNTEFYIPGFVNEAPAKVIPLEFLDNKQGVSTLLIDYARRFRKCKGILINTFTELEPLGVKALMRMTSDANNVPEIYPVGPLIEFEYKRQSGCGTEEFDWLNDQPLCSVVFLCFGSHGSFKDDQVKEIANGLECSGYRFLWSLHEPLSSVDALPEGFLERTEKRGKIVGWAPQVEILAHRAVGGFVSHCGWNSTLESLWFGVPMAAWPLYAEQQMNAFELVDELGIAVGIGVEDRRDSVVISAEEVENAVRKLMSLDENMKNKVKEMRDKSRNALEEDGSSHKWLSRFVEDVLSDVA